MTKQSHDPVARAAILEIVDNQLRDGIPPETRATLKRLMADGISEKEARELIACVVSTEIFEMLKSRQLHQEERYLAGLRALPRLPWENEEQSNLDIASPAKRAHRRRRRFPALLSMKEWSLRKRNRFLIALGRLFTNFP